MEITIKAAEDHMNLKVAHTEMVLNRIDEI